MQIEKLTDQWICSCGNWVDQAFSWCPGCCEDQYLYSEHMAEEQENPTELFAT